MSHVVDQVEEGQFHLHPGFIRQEVEEVLILPDDLLEFGTLPQLLVQFHGSRTGREHVSDLKPPSSLISNGEITLSESRSIV